MSGAFRSGQRVHVEYDGVVSGDRAGLVVWVIPDDHHAAFRAPLGHITAIEPKCWPPRVGDLWRANNAEWFAVKNHELNDTIFMTPEDMEEPWDLTEFKALNPRLIRRRT